MSRIRPVQPLDEQTLADLTPAERLERQQEAILAHRPALGESVANVSRMLASGEAGTLPSRLTELVRLRIAFWNQCRSCMSVRYDPGAVSEDLVCSLERPEEAEDLDAREKLALRYADHMATDHLAIDDAFFAELRGQFDEGEIVELGIACAQYVGYGRMAAIWALHDHLHPRFRREQDEAYTPWGAGALR